MRSRPSRAMSQMARHLSRPMASTTPPLLKVAGLTKLFRVGRSPLSRERLTLRAVDGISFEIARGEVLGLVGESGSGKTTVGRSVLRLLEPTSGAIHFKEQDVMALRGGDLRRFRRQAQIIFQDPFASLNPRMTVEKLLAEPLVVQGEMRGRKQLRERGAELLSMVGLASEHLTRYPHEFSGGQRQRIAIARGLALRPDFLVADEPVSALDVSVQAQVINLLRQLKQQLGLTMLFIGHDLAVVEYIADRIAVMYLGRIVEIAPARALTGAPLHPYTKALLSAVPVPDPLVKRTRIVLEGELPSAIDPPSGCVFRTRCPYAAPECANHIPELAEVRPGHFRACIRGEAVDAADNASDDPRHDRVTRIARVP
jgi:oligopeptide transport system ATP-binding protein